MSFSEPKYSRLETTMSETPMSESGIEEAVGCSRCKHKRHISPLLLIGGMILSFMTGSVSLGLLKQAETKIAQSHSEEYRPAVEEVGQRFPSQLQGAFEAPSKWRGEPSDEIDEAWERITSVGAMTVTKKDVEDRGMLRDSSVILTEGEEPGYMASIEAFHQVHCLNLLRKYSYLEYYEVKEPDFFHASTLRVHVDHCIELLRQVLMCSADLRVITYDWVEDVDFPWPDFSTNNMCRDYSKVHDWATQHAATTNSTGGLISKPAGASLRVLPEF